MLQINFDAVWDRVSNEVELGWLFGITWVITMHVLELVEVAELPSTREAIYF